MFKKTAFVVFYEGHKLSGADSSVKKIKKIKVKKYIQPIINTMINYYRIELSYNNCDLDFFFNILASCIIRKYFYNCE